MNILGISGAFGHDSASALIVDGQVIAACEEERFTRTKRALRQAASHSVQACLDAAKLDLQDIDCIAIGWDPELAPDDPRLANNLTLLRESGRFVDQDLPEFRRIPHHLAHAALGFHTSGFSEAAVLVVDGQGEDVSTTIWKGAGSSLSERVRFPIPDSLGFFFATVTRYLGFSPGSAGKTMGLAPLGEVTYDFPELDVWNGGYSIQVPGRTKPERMRWWLKRLADVFGPPPERDYAMNPATGRLSTSAVMRPHHADAAASAQAALERLMLHLANESLAITGSSNLVISGGVALNCSANGRLRGALASNGLFVNGAAHDGGTALGAALVVAAEAGELLAPERMRSLLVGPVFDMGPAVDMARRAGLHVTEPSEGVSRSAAVRLAASEVGGWFRGRGEYGPRALGGRSIVARADDREVAARVNRIKHRELWRPLAPAISRAQAAAFGFGDDGMDFMVEARWLGGDTEPGPLRGILHVDRSVRPLLVEATGHPLSSLLESMQEVVGQQAVTNTSFNTEQEPIVGSPTDAIRTFLTSDLDFLVLEEVLISKHAGNA